MRTSILFVTASFIFFSASLLPASARAAGGGAGHVFDVGYDIVVLRSLGAVATVIGAGLYVPAVFFTLPSGRAGIDQATSVFITAPIDNTFRRELGDW